MKIILLVPFLLYGSTLFAQSQPMMQRGMDGMGLQQIVSLYGQDLNLTEEQISELYSRQMNLRRTMREARVTQRDARRRGDMAERRVRQGDRQRATHSSGVLRSVLTEDQQAQLKQLRQERAAYNRGLRDIRHRVAVEQAGLEGDKAEQVLQIFKQQSERRYEADIAAIEDGESDRRVGMQQQRDHLDQLKSILTVEEFENLMQLTGQQPVRLNRHNQRMMIRRQ